MLAIKASPAPQFSDVKPMCYDGGCGERGQPLGKRLWAACGEMPQMICLDISWYS